MDDRQTQRGLAYACGAYALWGLIPLYFKALAHVRPLELLAHRVVWSFILLAVVVALLQKRDEVVRILCSRRVLLTLAATTALIAVNWLTYIYAVTSGQVLESSLGYFINPLMSVLLGVAVLKERMRPLQIASVTLAAAGVLTLGVAGDQFPWIALTLATSFAFYGLLRKTVAADGLMGLFVETLLLLPLCLGYVFWMQANDAGALRADDLRTGTLLVLSGPITAVPLLLFAAGARRLRLATMGFLQYIAPTLQFLLAVLIFREPFSAVQLASFTCIWTAIGVYSADSLLRYRQAAGVRASRAAAPAVSREHPLVPAPCGQAD